MRTPKQLRKARDECKPLTQEERIIADIYDVQQLRAHWTDMRNNGCSDPSWPDGVNLNLTRRHIIGAAERLAKAGKKEYLACVPDEVPENLMVSGGKWFDMRMKYFKPRFGDRLVIDEDRQLVLF